MFLIDTLEFEDIVRYAIAGIVILSLLLAIGYTIWGGFLIILSAGAEDKVKSAINHIRHAGLGVIVLFIVLFVTPPLTRLMWLNYDDYISPARIFQTVTEISSRVFGETSWFKYDSTESENNLPSDFSNL